MSRIGFHPQGVTRHVYRSQFGHKLAYVEDRDGHHFIKSLDGRTVAKILRYKNGNHRYADVTNISGGFVYGPYDPK